MKSVATAASWCPPYENQVKINFDVALFRESDSAGISVVIWNLEGGVGGSLGKNYEIPIG